MSRLKKKIKTHTAFKARQTLRFRKEKDFYLVNIQWGNTISVNNAIGKFLMEFKSSGKKFTIEDFPDKNIDWVEHLFLKGVIFSDSIKDDPEKFTFGVSANIEDLPNFHL